MTNKKRLFYIVSFVVAGCLTMAFVDAVLTPTYLMKSIAKLFIFLALPIGYAFFDRKISLQSLFKFNKKNFLFSLFLGLIVYTFILGAYFILSPYFDFSNITETLENTIGVNKDNFIFVALYISLINSLLEELFFRGFAFLTLKKAASRKFSYLFSAAAFSLYHIAIMTSWFSPLLFVLLIGSLFLAGLLFNWLNEKNDNIYSSWLVHMFANFAINTIGFILFGIL